MTDEMGCTPGPWKVYDYDNALHIEGVGRSTVARIANNQYSRANACTLAAAPDMRALIAAFLAAWDSGALGFWVERDVLPFRALLAKTPEPAGAPTPVEDATQGALFPEPAPKPPSAIAEGR